MALELIAKVFNPPSMARKWQGNISIPLVHMRSRQGRAGGGEGIPHGAVADQGRRVRWPHLNAADGDGRGGQQWGRGESRRGPVPGEVCSLAISRSSAASILIANQLSSLHASHMIECTPIGCEEVKKYQKYRKLTSSPSFPQPDAQVSRPSSDGPRRSSISLSGPSLTKLGLSASTPSGDRAGHAGKLLGETAHRQRQNRHSCPRVCC